MTLELDGRSGYSKNISFRMEEELFAQLTAAGLYDESKSAYLRWLVEEFFNGRKKANIHRFLQYQSSSDEPYRFQASFCVDRAIYEKLLRCAKDHRKSIATVVRAIFREMLFGFANPYRDWLLNHGV